MNETRLIQIIPTLPPATNGLGDYAFNLSQRLKKDYSTKTTFIISDKKRSKSSEINESIKNIEPSAKELYLTLKQLNPKNIVLHYVGYGYAKRGAPLWLFRGLDRWKKENKNSKLITMFHEIYATSHNPMKSSFWFSPIQKYISKKISKISNTCLVSNEPQKKKLSKLTKKQITKIPVFSNVGEIREFKEFSKKSKRLVIFGKRGKYEIYENHLPLLKKIIKKMNIQEVVDIGPEPNINLEKIGGASFIKKGLIDKKEIKKIFCNSVAGLINHKTNLLAKSGIFASYCAYGLTPIVIDDNKNKPCDGLKENVNFIKAESKMKMENSEMIAKKAHDWYQNHNIKNTAKIYKELIS